MSLDCNKKNPGTVPIFGSNPEYSVLFWFLMLKSTPFPLKVIAERYFNCLVKSIIYVERILNTMKNIYRFIKN